MPRVLIVEDDEVIADGMARHLQAGGFDARRRREGRAGAGATPLRAARCLRARPDAARAATAGADRDRPRRGDRDADRRRQRARHRARPRARARDRRRRLPGQAVLDEGARRARAGRRPPRRRPQETPRGEPIEIEELRIDPREVQAFVDGESADLTPTEFRLLYALALERGRVVTRDELLQRLWGRRETPPRPHGRRLRQEAA